MAGKTPSTEPDKNNDGIVYNAIIEFDSPARDSDLEVESAIKKALEFTLRDDLSTLHDLKVTIDVKYIRKGSLVIVFTVFGAGITLYALYDGISKYKNFVESLKIIQQHAVLVLKTALAAFGKCTIQVTQMTVPPAPINWRDILLTVVLLECLIAGLIGIVVLFDVHLCLHEAISVLKNRNLVDTILLRDVP